MPAYGRPPIAGFWVKEASSSFAALASSFSMAKSPACSSGRAVPEAIRLRLYRSRVRPVRMTNSNGDEPGVKFRKCGQPGAIRPDKTESTFKCACNGAYFHGVEGSPNTGFIAAASIELSRNISC